MKQCIKCGKTKPFSEFNKKRDLKDGLNSKCRSCANAETREWHRANVERKAAYQKKWREENVEHRAAYQKKWYKSNPEKSVFYRHLRRAKKASAVPQRLRRHEDHPAHLCYYCGKHTRVNVRHGRSDKRTTDHITPFALGGEAKPYNEVPACNSCNSRKRHKSPWAWMAEQF